MTARSQSPEDDSLPAKRARWSTSVTPVPKSQKPPGELLTPQEKKANHIASEQKRRQAIREGFDKLTEVVPGLTRAQGRSEAIVLQKTLSYLKSEIEQHAELVRRIEELGGQVPSELKVDSESNITVVHQGVEV
ncbi:hypothetical protein V1514DRAFT_338748 [Lipomyces japonicus]|uniref:uncharacterized protein n=1 Tax=Lipomyces japonicus TaxID=56871 RepID=UPI0034CE3083